MKPLIYFSAIIFLIFTVSHAFPFDLIASENHDDHHHDHLIESSSSSSSSNGGDSLTRLPVEIGSNQQPQLETTSSNNNDAHVIDVEQYLTELMNHRPVLLRNRFRFPRRCHHRFMKFGPGIQVGPKDDVASIFKKRAEVIRHRHVAGGFGGEEGEFFIVPVKHFHKMHLDHDHHDHHHHHHHGEVVDPTVEMKREEYEVKGEYDHDHHHHHHDHHHEHDDKKEENDIMKKIRKFLPLF